MRIVIPELKNPIIQESIKNFPDIDFVDAPDPESGAEMVMAKNADSMISGLDYSSRDIIIAYKNHIPLKSSFFSSCFVCQKDDTRFILADGGINKEPDEDKLYTIVEDSADTFIKYFGETPKIAMLSYSTNGSGGKNEDLDKIHFVIDKIKERHPDYDIDGEMQLDAAVNPLVAAKKYPSSPVAGKANILIVPDLNTGNILYKSLEQFGGFTIAGPIVQGFIMPLADLSRGSTTKDVTLTIDVVKTLLSQNNSSKGSL